MKNLLIGNQAATIVVAEIGINHNGSLEIAQRLMDAAKAAGADAVKFQKRTVEVVYTEEELSRPRESPFGKTNGDLKRGLEFGKKEYDAIDQYAKTIGLPWFASCWDEASVDFMSGYSLPAWKIAAASLTDHELLAHTRNAAHDAQIIASTGMSSLDEIDCAVKVLGKDNLVLLHCRSTYPAAINELNLSAIKTLADRYNVPVGYSGHEVGIYTSLAAVAMGAVMVERHLTLDRSMWGSDQAASVEPKGFSLLVEAIRTFEEARGDGIVRCYPSEVPIKAKLRRK